MHDLGHALINRVKFELDRLRNQWNTQLKQLSDASLTLTYGQNDQT